MANFFSARASQSTSQHLSFMLKCSEEQIWGRYTFDKGVKYLRLNDLMMIDWDPVEPGTETDHHYTVENKEEVYEILNERIKDHPDELWKAYETPSGGIHAFLISHEMSPEEGYDIITEMKGDTLYRDLSLQRGAWGVRISPKPKRLGDFVARFVGYWGDGVALEKHLKVMDIHDTYLR